MSEKSKGELFAEACESWSDYRENNRHGGSPDEIRQENVAWCTVYDFFENELKEVERLRAENAELREHSDAYKRVCETLGYAEGADGRSGAHYADSKTVCDALKHMKWAQSILEEATYRCIDCGEVFHPTCPTCPPKPGAGT